MTNFLFSSHSLMTCFVFHQVQCRQSKVFALKELFFLLVFLINKFSCCYTVSFCDGVMLQSLYVYSIDCDAGSICS